MLIGWSGHELFNAGCESLCDKGSAGLLTLVVHTVHDGHEPLQPRYRLLLIALRHEVTTQAWDHPLNHISRSEISVIVLSFGALVTPEIISG